MFLMQPRFARRLRIASEPAEHARVVIGPEHVAPPVRVSAARSSAILDPLPAQSLAEVGDGGLAPLEGLTRDLVPGGLPTGMRPRMPQPPDDNDDRTHPEDFFPGHTVGR